MRVSFGCLGWKPVYGVEIARARRARMTAYVRRDETSWKIVAEDDTV